MHQRKFFLYQMVTGNLARVINSLGQYDMMLNNFKKGEEQKLKNNKDYSGDNEVSLEIKKCENEMKVLEEKKNLYIQIKNEIENKYLDKYYKKYNRLDDGWIRKMNDVVLRVARTLKIK